MSAVNHPPSISNSVPTGTHLTSFTSIPKSQLPFNRFTPTTGTATAASVSSSSSKNSLQFYPQHAKSSQTLHHISQNLSTNSPATSSHRIAHHNSPAPQAPYGLHQNQPATTLPNSLLTSSLPSNRLATSPGVHNVTLINQYDNRSITNRNTSTSPSCHTLRSDKPTPQLILHQYPSSQSIASYASIPDDSNTRYASPPSFPIQQKLKPQSNSFAALHHLHQGEACDNASGIRVVHSIHSEPRSRHPSSIIEANPTQPQPQHQQQQQQLYVSAQLTSSARQLYPNSSIPSASKQQAQQARMISSSDQKPIGLLHHFSSPVSTIGSATKQKQSQQKISRPIHLSATENSTSISKLENSSNFESHSFLRSARDLHIPLPTSSSSSAQLLLPSSITKPQTTTQSLQVSSDFSCQAPISTISRTQPLSSSQEPKGVPSTIPLGNVSKMFSQTSQSFWPTQPTLAQSPSSQSNQFKHVSIPQRSQPLAKYSLQSSQNQQQLNLPIETKTSRLPTRFDDNNSNLLESAMLTSGSFQLQTLKTEQSHQGSLEEEGTLMKPLKGLFQMKSTMDSSQHELTQTGSLSENPSFVFQTNKPTGTGINSLFRSQTQYTVSPSQTPPTAAMHPSYLYQHLGYNSSGSIDLINAIHPSMTSTTATKTSARIHNFISSQSQHQKQQQQQPQQQQQQGKLHVDVLLSKLNGSNQKATQQENATPAHQIQPTQKPQTSQMKVANRISPSPIESAFNELKVSQQSVLPSRNSFPLEGYSSPSQKERQQQQQQLQQQQQQPDSNSIPQKPIDQKIQPVSRIQKPLVPSVAPSHATSAAAPKQSQQQQQQFSDIIGLKQRLSSVLESTDRITELFRQHKVGANLILQQSAAQLSKNSSQVSTPSSTQSSQNQPSILSKQPLRLPQPSIFSLSESAPKPTASNSSTQPIIIPNNDFNSSLLLQPTIQSDQIPIINQDTYAIDEEPVKRASKNEEKSQQNQTSIIETSAEKASPVVAAPSFTSYEPTGTNNQEMKDISSPFDGSLKTSILYTQHQFPLLVSKNNLASDPPFSQETASTSDSPDLFKSISKSSNMRKNIVFSLATEASCSRTSHHAFCESDNLQAKASHHVLTSRILESKTSDFMHSSDSLGAEALEQARLEPPTPPHQVEPALTRVAIRENYGQKDFYLIRRLGKGKHSEVYLAQDKATGFLFAVKQIYKGEIIGMEMEQQLSQEIRLQSLISHPNVLSLYGFIEDADYVYLFMEYAPSGEISSYLASNPERRFSEPEAAFYLSQLADALVYLHRKNIVHRDIKPDNLLFSNGVLKLADFGYSSLCKTSALRTTFCGTLDYLSPKMINGENYGTDVDVWSFGVLAYEFLQGVAPFYEDCKDATMRKISQGKFDFIHSISNEAQEFINSLLETNPAQVLSMRAVSNLPWLRENADRFRRETTTFSGEHDRPIANDPLARVL